MYTSNNTNHPYLSCTLTGSGNADIFHDRDDNSSLPKSFKIPNSIIMEGEKFYVTGIARAGFCNSDSVRNITLSDNIHHLFYSTFRGCKNLEEVAFSKNSISTIGGYVFADNPKLTKIKFPECLKSIGEAAFYNCASLESIVIPNKVTNIGAFIFQDCISLKDVRLSTSLTAISPAAFYNCFSLSNIEIPEGVTNIMSHAFENCRSLRTIALPDSLEYILNDAFTGCSNFAVVCNPETFAEKWAKSHDIPVFSRISSLEKLLKETPSENIVCTHEERGAR